MRLNTNGDIFPAGFYRFKVAGVPEKGQTPGGYAYYQFQFMADVEGEERAYSERFMVWLMAPLCRALGFEEVAPGEFEFDAASCLGKEVDGIIAHEKIAKGPSAGQVVARMKEIAPVVKASSNGKSHPGSPPVKAAAGKGADEDIPF